MKKIALCGPSGVGKSYVSEIIRSNYRFPVLDTDQVVHMLYSKDTELISTLADAFGRDILSNGCIDRKALGPIVFSDKSALERLNHIVHKRVREYIFSWLDIMEKERHSVAFVDIPQIVESGMKDDFDLIIAVSADESTRLERILSRDGITLEGARKRIENQLPVSSYEEISDYIIHNNGNSDIEERIREIFCEIDLIEQY